MTLTTTRQPDLHDEPDIATMDTIATGVAQQVADNTLDEHPARAQILSCLVSSPAIAAMVELFRRQTPSSAESMSEAVRTECEKRLRVKVLATNGAGLDLELLTTSSATGWAERFLRSGAQWIFANAARSGREDATDPYTMSRSSLWAAESTPSLAQVHRDVYAWMAKTNSTRKQLRSARSAVALRVAYDIPDMLRPHYTQRHQITDLLNHDPYRAYTAAKQQLYVVTGSAADIGQRDDRLMAL